MASTIPKRGSWSNGEVGPPAACTVIFLLATTLFISAQTPYQAKFPGDPARSDSEASALGYMRTVIRAERQYQKKNDGKFATSLDQLVHTGSFTKRMTATDRGDYKVSFRSRKGKAKAKDKDKDKDQEGYELTLIPQQLNSEHRSFYADEDGQISADEDSLKVK
jgi:hypothetical protein